jgi:hypothetical protein
MKKSVCRLDGEQKKLLKCLKRLGIYFIPFTVDGNWDYADNIKVMDIEEFTFVLEKYNEWSYDVLQCSLNYTVYMLELTFYSEFLKKDILLPFQKFKNHYWDVKVEDNITIYLRYSDMCRLQKKGCVKRKRNIFYR